MATKINLIYEGGVFFDVRMIAIVMENDRINYIFGSDYTMIEIDSGITIKKFVNREKMLGKLVDALKFIEGHSYDHTDIQGLTYDCLYSLNYCEEKKPATTRVLSTNTPFDE